LPKVVSFEVPPHKGAVAERAAAMISFRAAISMPSLLLGLFCIFPPGQVLC
jgi:hypothetical protein